MVLVREADRDEQSGSDGSDGNRERQDRARPDEGEPARAVLVAQRRVVSDRSSPR